MNAVTVPPMVHLLIRRGYPVARLDPWPDFLPTTKPGRHNPNVPAIDFGDLPRITDFETIGFLCADHGDTDTPPPPVVFRPRGKIGQTVFQGTLPLIGDCLQSPVLKLQRRRMVIPADPRTDAQLMLRARFGRAVQLWHGLTDAQRADYCARAGGKRPWLEGLNLWIREFARAHPPSEFADLIDALRSTGSVPPPE